jgi:hypothetical protein
MPMCDVGVVMMMMMRDSGFFGGAESLLLPCLLASSQQTNLMRLWVGFACLGAVLGGLCYFRRRGFERKKDPFSSMGVLSPLW